MGLGSRSKIIGVATLNIYNIGYGVVKSYMHIPPKGGSRNRFKRGHTTTSKRIQDFFILF